MAVISPLFLILLVAFVEFEASAAVDCTQVGGICIPLTENAKCVPANGQCSSTEICCKACSSIPTTSCALDGGYCVKKPTGCPSGNIVPSCSGKKCKLCCMRVPPPRPSCQSYTGVYGTYGEVMMPDNGLIPYQDNLDCSWTIEVPYGYWISINILTFDLEGCCYDCAWDYLQFSDGSPYMQWPGERLCGTMGTITTSFLATTNIMQVYFHSDISVGKTGFYFTWSAIAQPSCPAYTPIYGYSGEVYMPDNGIYPYQNNQNCEWFIEVPYGYVITIYITSFELEGPSYSCPWDYLQFFDASGYSSWESQKLCGTIGEIQTTFNTSTNMILAVFHSDSSVVFNGFTFSWYAEAAGSCSPYSQLYGDNGVVYMPDNGVGPYHNYQYCEWRIEVSYGYGIYIDILNFELEGSLPSCPFDYLQFFDASGNFLWQTEKLCGTIDELITHIYAPTNIILVVFQSDSSVVYNGFTFTWSAGAQPSCPAYSPVYGYSGEVYMPDNGIGPYQNNQNCEWFIEVPFGYRIIIYITSFELEGPSNSCPWDYLQFFDASGYSTWTSQKLCGTIGEIQTSFYTSTNMILAVFHSDSSVIYNGFTFSWYAEIIQTSPPPGSCSSYSTLYGDYGVVYMPYNGIGPYMNYQNCEWYIEVSYGFGINIDILSFELEGPAHCPYDYLQFFDASGNVIWQTQKLCGTMGAIQTHFYAPTNIILAVFHSDGSVVFNGFTFTWSAAVPGTPAAISCAPSTALSSNYGIVTMPDNGYPPYQNYQDCEWYIEVPFGYGIDINIINLNLEGSAGVCPFDYLQFFDASGYAVWQSPKLCGDISQGQTYFWAPTNVILAVFHSDISVVGNGFTFTWYASGTATTSPNTWYRNLRDMQKGMDLPSKEKSPKGEKSN